jgi:hypothetical protein
MTQPALFDSPPEPPVKLSAGRRRTLRQTQLLHAGRHPLSAIAPLPLHPDAPPPGDRDAPGPRCGNCAFRVAVRHHERRYAKCSWPGGTDWPRASHGPATDLRDWWPACRDHQPPSEDPGT